MKRGFVRGALAVGVALLLKGRVLAGSNEGDGAGDGVAGHREAEDAL